MLGRIRSLGRLLVLAGLTLIGSLYGSSALAAAPEKCHSTAVAVLWIGPFEARPGALVPLVPQWTSSPGDFQPIPAECWGSPSVAPESAAKVTADGGGVQISPQATDGEQIPVSVLVDGRVVKGAIRVVDPMAHPLAGRWIERSVRCDAPQQTAGHQPIKELEFAADGRFSVTWAPFETYRDYWGSYAFDPKRGSLSFQVTGGNHVPVDLHLVGTARLSDTMHILTLSGLSLGEPEGPSLPQSCTITFGR